MENLSLLFPGQGSQIVGMGKLLCQSYLIAQDIFQEASDILKLDMSALCFDSDPVTLTQTENAQPALLTIGYAIYILLDTVIPIKPIAMAGHSLGEITALTCANALSFAEALKLVRKRGLLMKNAAAGGMAALIGADYEAATQLCQQASSSEHSLQIANYNAEKQIVLSGSLEALAQAESLAPSIGAGFTHLNVSGAFHSRLMQPAAEKLKEALAAIQWKTPSIPVLSNVTATPHSSAAQIPELLYQQILSPVLWHPTMLWLENAETTVAIECGPKNVLRNLYAQERKQIDIISSSTIEDLAEIHELDPDNFTCQEDNPVEKCLYIAVSTPNRNFDNPDYQQTVIEPYRSIKKLFYDLAEVNMPPDEEDLDFAFSQLKRILDGKGVPLDEQRRLFKKINHSTDLSAIYLESNVEEDFEYV